MQRLNASDAGFADAFDALVNGRREADADVSTVVTQTIRDVRARGDVTLAEMTQRFDGFDLNAAGWQIDAAQCKAAYEGLAPELRDALTANGLEWEELPGEGAFYAPKLEWHLTDAIGRTWQVGTIQSDRVLPERLDAHYIGEDGEKHRPVMLHRAIFGSYERFIGILIEHFAGKLPVWLAPTQAVVATIVSDADDYAREVAAKLAAAGIRVETDLRNEKINYKVREHSLGKVPVLLAVGMKEVADRSVSIRRLGDQVNDMMTLDDAISTLGYEALPPAA